VDPTIAAACITGGVGALGIAGTVVTSVVGSRNTRKAAEQAIAAGAASTSATLAAAREDRLWEKRCAAYEETLAALLYRRDKRFWGVAGAWDKAAAKELRNAYDEYRSTTWFERRGRLYAYASEAVRAASDAALQADVKASTLSYAAEDFRKSALDLLPNAGETLQKITDGANSAHNEVRAADDALIEVIREELRSRPEAAMPPAQVPAVHRGFWRR
jgi:hypothetical protein